MLPLVLAVLRVEGAELVVHTAHPPVLCTGFEGSVAAIGRDLFDLADDSGTGCIAGAPLLTAEDESTKTPGVFLVGPTVGQGELSFCFVYKFRQRFGVVANAICMLFFSVIYISSRERVQSSRCSRSSTTLTRGRGGGCSSAWSSSSGRSSSSGA